MYVVSKWLTCVPSFFETIQAVQEFKSGHEIANGRTDEHRGYKSTEHETKLC